MGRSKFTPTQRLTQFPNSGLIVKDAKLWCTKCETIVSHDRKDGVEKHTKSKQHLEWNEAAKNTVPLSSKGQTINELELQWNEMVSSFVAAGVPLHIFRNEKLRDWMKKYVTHGSKLPSETTMRRSLEPLSVNDTQATIELCKDKDICIIMDETTDSKTRKVLNVLVCPLEPGVKPRLWSTTFLENCNKKAIVEATISTITNLHLELDNLVMFITDNAPYMIAAGDSLSKVCERLTHSTCWAHILHLVSEEIRDQMQIADTFIANVKKALLKAPARRNSYFESMEFHKVKAILPPTPIITRWTTWLAAGNFHWMNFKPLCHWIEKSDEKTGPMKSLKSILKENGEILAQELERINKIFPSLSESIKKLEGNSLVASEIYGNLSLIENYLKTLGIPSSKLHLYLNHKHPALDFWKDVQVFDFRKCPTDIENGLPKSLLKFGKTAAPLEELLQYKQLAEYETTKSPSTRPLVFWKKYQRELPILAEIAVKALSVFGSSSEAERSFSYLKKTLSPQRMSLTEENLSTHLRLIYNSKSICLPIDETESDDES